MILRYHLTNGTTLDEPVSSPVPTAKEMSVALAETLLFKMGKEIQLVPVLAVDVLTREVAAHGYATKPVRNMIFTNQILRIEIILDELEQRREAGAEGKN